MYKCKKKIKNIYARNNVLNYLHSIFFMKKNDFKSYFFI